MIKVLNKLVEYILVTDKNGGIKFCNNSLLNKLSYTRDEIEAINLQQVVCENNSMPNIHNFIDKKMETSLLTKNNEKINVTGDVTIDKWKNEELYFIILQEAEDSDYTKEDLINFLDDTEYSMWIKDLSGKYIYANKKTEKIFGATEGGIIGHTDESFWGKDFSEKFRLEDNNVVSNRKSVFFEKEVFNKADKRLWFESYKAPIYDEYGNVKYVGGMAREITLRKALEIQVENSQKRLASLENLINGNYDEIICYENLNDFSNQIMKNIGCDGVNIWVYDKKDDTLVSKYRAGIATDIVGDKVKIPSEFDKSKGFVDRMLYVSNPNIRKFHKDGLERNNVEYLGYYCINFNNEYLGVMVITYKYNNLPKPNNDKHIKAISKQLGVIIKNNNFANELAEEFKKRVEIEEELEHFLNTAVDIMTISNKDNRFIKVSKGFSKSLGYSKEELLSMKWTDVIHPDDLDKNIEKAKNIGYVNNITQKITNRYIAKDGNIRWIDWRIKYLAEKDVFISTAKDITDERKMEEERKKYQETLIHEQVKNEFFANISHEFKTPLNIILATLQLINKELGKNEIRVIGDLNIEKYMKSMKQNSYRLLRLVNNLIDITRIDTGYYTLNLENNNIIRIVEDITISVAEYVRDNEITLIFDTEIEEEIIACDPDKIERIMLNLLSNAIKYTSKNGEIYVNLSIDSQNIAISVKDDGIGIPEEKLMSIFDRFTQVDNLLTRKAEGSGIGLSLVKSLVELHGGSIVAKSKIGAGTEFIFTLPRKVLEDKEDISVRISENTLNSKVEKCNVEFSDIYSLT